MHSNFFAHLDVKPENVFLRQKNGSTSVVLGDLGVSRCYYSIRMANTKNWNPSEHSSTWRPKFQWAFDLTRMGLHAVRRTGTPWRKLVYRFSADRHSVVYVFMITGRLPFELMSRFALPTVLAQQTLVELIDSRYDYPGWTLFQHVPPMVRTIIRRLSVLDPIRRPGAAEVPAMFEQAMWHYPIVHQSTGAFTRRTTSCQAVDDSEFAFDFQDFTLPPFELPAYDNSESVTYSHAELELEVQTNSLPFAELPNDAEQSVPATATVAVPAPEIPDVSPDSTLASTENQKKKRKVLKAKVKHAFKKLKKVGRRQ